MINFNVKELNFSIKSMLNGSLLSFFETIRYENVQREPKFFIVFNYPTQILISMSIYGINLDRND